MKHKTTLLTLVLLAATVPFNLGGCGSDPISSIGQGVGSLAGGGRSTGNKNMDYVGAGIKATQAMALGEKDEQEMGRAVAIAMTNQYPVYNNPLVTDYVTKVGLTVAAFSSRTEVNYVFGILDTDEIGAFSGPSGYVMITRGALAQMQDESELAGVLAHEIAHVAKKHGLEAVRNAKLTQAGVQAGTAGTALAQTNLIDGVVDTIIKSGYSKPQENDADGQAVKYLAAGGYDPHGFLHFLQRLEQLRGSTKGLQNVMSTHPGLDERVAHVQKKINDLKNPGGATLKDRFAKNVVLSK